MKKKNSGFSLIEVVVVIAIMGVVTAGVSIAVFSQSSYKCKQAKDAIFNVLQQTRSEALAKDKAWMELCYEDDQCVLKSSFGEDQKFGKQVSVTYDYQKGQTASVTSGSISIDASNSLVLTFKRGTGGFKTMKLGIEADGSYKEATALAGSAAYCSAIHVRVKGKSSGYTIYLHPVTGKFECEKD